MSTSHNNKLELLKEKLPANHPILEVLEGKRERLNKVQRLERLKQVLPANHPLIVLMEAND